MSHEGPFSPASLHGDQVQVSDYLPAGKAVRLGRVIAVPRAAWGKALAGDPTELLALRVIDLGELPTPGPLSRELLTESP